MNLLKKKFKKAVFDKWNFYPELKPFIAYVIPVILGHIFKSPPGFANTNIPILQNNKGQFY